MAFLETKYLYFYLLCFTILYPLAQSFERRLQLYKKWKAILTGVFAVLIVFIPWDVYFTNKAVWWFSEGYTTGVKLFNLPIEEVLFFVFVYITRKVAVAKEFLAVFLAIAIVTMVLIRDHGLLYWLFPAIIAFYYILPERAAALICILAITVIAAKLTPILSFVDLITIIMSLLLTSFFGYMIFTSYRKTNEKLTLLATIDPLTLCGNRRALDTKLADVIIDQKRKASTISLLLLDLDLFKKINDEHGHAVGDEILVEAASVLTKNTRALDSVYRYGGEEFIIMPLSVDLTEATAVAEKLRLLISNKKYVKDLALTMSIGVAQYRAGETAEAWIARADAALYMAKDMGRNRVVTELDVCAEKPA